MTSVPRADTTNNGKALSTSFTQNVCTINGHPVNTGHTASLYVACTGRRTGAVHHNVSNISEWVITIGFAVDVLNVFRLPMVNVFRSLMVVAVGAVPVATGRHACHGWDRRFHTHGCTATGSKGLEPK